MSSTILECKECSKKYKTNRGYNDHMMNIHPTREQLIEKKENKYEEQLRELDNKNSNRGKEYYDGRIRYFNAHGDYQKRYWIFDYKYNSGDCCPQEYITPLTDMTVAFDTIDDIKKCVNNKNVFYIFDSVERQFIKPADIGIDINYQVFNFF